MKKMNLVSAVLAAILAVLMTGCGMNMTAGSPAAENNTAISPEVSAADEETAQAVNANAAEGFEVVAVSQTYEAYQENSELFTKRDLAQTADTSDAAFITVSDRETIDITEEGVYVISGTAENCTVKVSAGSDAKVQLVLDGVSITNSDFPAIYVEAADKVFVTTTDSENTLTVSGQFTADGDTNTDAVIFSKDDLVLNGTGTLIVTSAYGNGISGKDDLKVTGGTYQVTSALHAFEANDSISVCDGIFTVNANKDGFHCENDDTAGTITVSGGSFTIRAASDGIHAAALLQIDGGSMTVTASEGLEAAYVLINGGDIDISANDDGINAADQSASVSTPTVEINDGNVNITMSGNDVDCIDVNGDIIVSGGTIQVTYPEQGPSESFDYDGTAAYNGGTIIINGTQVDSIPQGMMGGRMNGGNMQGDMGGFGGRMHRGF